MLGAKMRQENVPPVTTKGYDFWEDLINHGEEVKTIDLINALNNKEITPEQHLELQTKLSTREELIKEELANTARTVTEEKRQLKFDFLTGLPNRATLVERLEEFLRELYFSNRNRRASSFQSVVVIALDMNFLKILNDKYGHIIGDKGIVALAGILKKVTRNNDVVARMGGDEFVIVLPIENEKDSQSADLHKRLFKEIQEKVNKLSINFEYGNVLIDFPIKTAMGYAVLNKGDSPKTAEALLCEADLEMYKNKAEMKRT